MPRTARLGRAARLLLIAALLLGLAAGRATVPAAPGPVGAPAPAFLLAEPELLARSGIPVRLPRQVPTTSFYTAALRHGFAAVDTAVGRHGYRVAFPFGQTRVPPWHDPAVYRGFVPARTELSVAGADLTPGAATRYLGLPAGLDLRRLPGLAVPLGAARTGYLSFYNDWGGNGGSLTRLTWRQGAYLYQVAYPAPAGEGGRRAVLAMARGMVALRQIQGGSFSFVLVDRRPGRPTEQETVQLSPVSLAAAQYPSLAPGARQGVGQGGGWRYRFRLRRISVAPVRRTILAQASGPALAGRWVTIRGRIRPAPAGGYVGAQWLTTGPRRVAVYPADQPVAYWDQPFSLLPAAVGRNGRFSLRVRVPRAVQAVAAGEPNRWIVLEPGPQQLRVFYGAGVGQSAGVGTTVTVQVSGVAPAAAGFQAGPYLGGTPTAPLPYRGLQALSGGLGSGSFAVPFLLPAWAPPALAPQAFLSQRPGTWLRALPDGYLFLEFPPGVFFKATLPATPDAALLEGADLAVYGTRGPGPWGAPPGRSVSLRGRFGTLSVGGGAALLRFSWHGVNYGVRATGPGAADGVVEMARSMSEVSGAPGWSSADLVRALGYLARHAPDRALALWEPTPSFTGPPATFAALLRRWREAPSFRLRVIHAGASRVLAEVTLGRQREAISFQVTDRSPLGEGGWWVQGFRVARGGS